MILVIFVVSIALLVLSFTVLSWDDDISMVFGVPGLLGCVVSLIAIVILLVSISNASVLDEKIAMYQEENARIEEQIASVVEQYQKYETDIFTSVAPDDSAITLVALYPELKSDTLVQSQIDIYVQNNEKIKELKEAEISASVKRWWLYFGG